MAEAGGGGSSTPQYLYIGGKIWIDKKEGKQKEYDDLYNSSSESLYTQPVKISLINSSGTTVGTPYTTTNGTYSINTGIAINSSTSIQNSLSGYYLKFEYSDKYSTVSPKFEEQNGSKALIQEGKEGIAYIYNLSDYADKFYKYSTLDHMNMGLIGIEQADYEITQNIAYVKVVMNGYTYTYEYGGTGDTTKTAAPTINWKNGNAYTREIYPSDIVYSMKNDWNNNSLKVYVVYRIDINNTNMTNYGKDRNKTTLPVAYVEKELKVTSLTNTYDTSRYDLEPKYDKENNKDFDDWEDNDKDGVATYTGNKLDNGIVPNSPRTVYIQFKVKNEALENLLNQKESDEKKPTIATAHAYHDYWKAHYEWYNSGDDWKQKLVFNDLKTDDLEKYDDADYLLLKINTERTITGTVFEDENQYQNGEVIGDSMYGTKPNSSEKENTISNVKVELFSESGDKAILYYNKDNTYVEEEAQTVSNIDGTYSFKGVTPGKYYVRFTYGDLNGDGEVETKIIKPDGTEEGSVSIADYKSTIISEDCIRKALGYYDGVKGSDEWYKHETHPSDTANTTNSTAVDNLEQRAEYNTGKNQTTGEELEQPRNNISANTALMSIGLENTTGNYATITESDNGTKETILGINFGIIDIPEVSIAFDKVVNNIQITNAQGNILAEGNPASQNVAYVSDLDDSEHIVPGSQYTKSEISEDQLYGSTLKLKYAITVQNNSEVNYYYEERDKESKYYGYYYMFGETSSPDGKTKATEVTITVDNVLDFIDPSIKYENISIDSEHKKAQLKASDNQDIITNMQNKTGTSLTYEYLVDITDWEPIYTTKNKDNSEDKTRDTAEMTVTKLLSTEDNDLGVSNVAQVTELHITDRPTLIETINASDTYFGTTNPTDEVYVMITPPTGEDKITVLMYVVIGALALSVISVGVILIKKKVLRK